MSTMTDQNNPRSMTLGVSGLPHSISEGSLADDERTEAETFERGSGKGDLPPVAAQEPKGLPDPLNVEMDENHMNGRNKKKHRRGKCKGGKHHRNRKWKPYNQLTWDEKKELEEKETERATQKRERRFASGMPMAPYNTTQFLMEQHHPGTPEFRLPSEGNENPNHNHHKSGDTGSGSMDSSDEQMYDSPNDDEEIFLEKEFAETYESFHAERLQGMSKDDLVREYLELETKVEKLESKLKERKSIDSQPSDSVLPTEETLNVIAKLQAEIDKLRKENDVLAQENDSLKTCKSSQQ